MFPNLHLNRVLAATCISLTSVALLSVAPLGAQQSEPTCFGMTPSQAEAAGFTVQVGGPGDDLFFGGNTTRDFMIGAGGNDVLTGAGAGDVICGGDGNDILSAGDGNDAVDGGAGRDEITLGAGNDRALGGSGNDNISAGAGNDRVAGGTGADTIAGDDGNDVLGGNIGSDTIEGGGGRDILIGGRNDDVLKGGSGRDKLIAGGGNDELIGGPHRDRLRAGPGADSCQPQRADFHVDCETDLDGDEIEDVRPTQPVATQTEPSPPEGHAVLAQHAPQGVNKYGWPLLTQVGLDAMLFCESTNNHAINTGNGFFGGVQWLPATWNAAARGAGYDQYVGVLPNKVPADVQDEVTKYWWSVTRPNTQWPHCHVKAMKAMNVLAP